MGIFGENIQKKGVERLEIPPVATPTREARRPEAGQSNAKDRHPRLIYVSRSHKGNAGGKEIETRGRKGKSCLKEGEAWEAGS